MHKIANYQNQTKMGQRNIMTFPYQAYQKYMDRTIMYSQGGNEPLLRSRIYC